MSSIIKSFVAYLFAGLLLLTSLTIGLIGPIVGSDGEVPAHIQQTDGLTVYVNDPEVKLHWNDSADIYQVTWRTDTWHTYTVIVLNSSHPLDNITITWYIQTEAGTYRTYESVSLYHSYDNPGEYWINVSAEDPDEKNDSKSIFVTVREDMEGDGLPDWWEIKYFGSIATADETSNYDGDQWTDFEEYELGTDPTVADYPEEPTFLEDYWWVLALVAALVAVLLLYQFLLRPRIVKKRREEEQKKIAAALEIEKALESEVKEEKK